MTIDWGFAGQIGGVGFGVVFILLAILAIFIWLTGWVNTIITLGKAEVSNKKKGD